MFGLAEDSNLKGNKRWNNFCMAIFKNWTAYIITKTYS